MWVFFSTIPFTHLENIWSQFRYWAMMCLPFEGTLHFRGYIVINRLKTKKSLNRYSSENGDKKTTKVSYSRCLSLPKGHSGDVEHVRCMTWKSWMKHLSQFNKMARSLQKWKFAFQMICLSLAAVIRWTSTTWRNSFFSVSTSSCFLSTDLFGRHTVLFYVSSRKYLLS